ncbi:MAG: ABC transporter ATP-binding protein [Desulfurococcales archaeon]|nr:ABC transporter ATP-binding protein [Desulfurococcales archaeon]
MSSLLEVKGLRTYYFTLKGVVKAVDNVTFSLGKGEVLGVAGESGSGKSTLAWSLMGYVPPPGRIAGGQILLDGEDVAKMSEDELRRKVRWKKVSMIFQGAMNALTPVFTIEDQMAEPFIIHMNMTKREARERIVELLKEVGLDESFLRRYPHELSGGQKQRIVIAMALLLNPELVIADEPTTALDVVVQAQIMNLFKKIKKEYNISMIFITHDLSIIAEIADKVAVMYAGKVVELGTSEQIFLNPQHPYTQGLLKSIPKLRSKEKISWIPGTPPNLVTPPPGCRFHPRCPYVMDVCKRDEPPMVEVEPGHFVACHLISRR